MVGSKVFAVFLICSLAFRGASAQYCGLKVPLLDTFDYEAWSGFFRYYMYIGTYPELAVTDDCTAEEWTITSKTDYVWNVTHRYLEGDEVVTGSYGGTAVLEEDWGAGNFFLDASATIGGKVQTHLMMLETDYETYAAYIECDVDLGYNYPIVQSSTTDIDPILLARITDQFQSLGANMDSFVQIKHDDECTYEF